MKQKILYMLMMITVLLGGNGEAWGQSEVPGYIRTTVNVDYTPSSDEMKNISGDKKNNGILTLSNNYTIDNNNINTTITIGDKVKEYASSRVQLFVGDKGRENYIRWNVPTGYYLLFNSLTAVMSTSVKNNVTLTQYNSLGNKIDENTFSIAFYSGIWPNKEKTTISINNLSLTNNDYIKITIVDGQIYYYIYSFNFKYSISKYSLITTALDEATDYADIKSSSIDESIRDYLTTAISNAITFKDACAFPNSYWNGSPVGNTPADVTTTAEKLNAITNYLIARTNANKYEQSKVPNVVYNRLHSYDQYNPNEFDTGTINTATEDIKAAINVANATTDAYQKALSTIASAENSSAMTNDPTTLAADITKAKTQLEEASDVNGINAALANIKQFDTITFNQQNEIQEGSTLTASTKSGKAITYTSSDNAILDGTTLKALKAGKVTITASTSTGNGYYGYTTTKEFTVTPKPMELEPTTGNLPVAEVEYPTITLKRTLSGICTLTLPFTTSIGEIAPGQAEAWAAQLALVTYNQADEYTLYFCKTDGTINANQPYVINLPNAVTDKQWTNITPTESPDPGNMTCNVVGYNKEIVKWTMQGNYTPNTDMNGKYGIAGGRFRLGTEGSTINAYTAYFFNSLGREKVRARVAVMDEAGNTTYIGELKDGLLQTEESIYGLDGTRLPEMRKGINIVRQKDGSVRKIVK